MEVSNRDISTILRSLAVYYKVTTLNISMLKKQKDLKKNNKDICALDTLILELENDLISAKNIIERFH